MIKNEIENKDQELVKKFRVIMQNKKKKTPPNRFPVWLLFLFTAFLVSSIFFVKQQPETLSPKASKKSLKPSMAPIAHEQKPSNVNIAKSNPLTDDLKNIPSPGNNDSRNAMVISPDPDVIKPVIEKKSSDTPLDQIVQREKPSTIRIEEIISCTSVVNRQYKRPQHIFSLEEDATAKVWMNVVSQHPPFTLTHIYYINDKKYCEVPLAIRHQRMRTWSSITLRTTDHIGRWRVEVITDKGIKLGQTEFTVVR